MTHPLLKKSTLDPADLNSYRPISNLSFVSKTVERIIDSRLTSHAHKHSLFPTYQSAYRSFYSTETALVCIHNDLIGAMDAGHVGALVLLDLSAAFDTVEHVIMMEVLEKRFGLEGKAYDWFGSYFSDRRQVICAGTERSAEQFLTSSVPQGSVLGPKSFMAYAEDVAEIFESHEVQHHLYADDMQSHAHSKPSEFTSVITKLQNCAVAVSDWCRSKRLQLNAKKTECMYFGSAINLQKIPDHMKRFSVGNETVEPVSVVRNLGVLFDEHLSMKAHISNISRTCFFHLRRLRSVRHQLGREITQQLVSAFVLSRLDYCNAVLAGLPDATLAPLQRVLNASARLILDLRPRDHVTPALKELHWLPIRQRIEYKLCLLVYLSINDRAPCYLRDKLTFVSDRPGRASLRSAQTRNLDVPRTRLRLGERAFQVAAPTAWNKLPEDIKCATTTALFKKKLKTFLFKSAYIC